MYGEQELNIFFLHSQNLVIRSIDMDNNQLQENYEKGELKRFFLKLSASAHTQEIKPQITVPLEFLILPKGIDESAIRIPAQLRSGTWSYNYICGSTDFRYSIGRFYSGSISDIAISFNSDNNYFKVSKPFA